jgi:uncharacterized protein
MFNLSDRTYTRMPPQMGPGVIDATWQRIGEYLDLRNPESFAITLHGGEPTLWPLASFERFLTGLENLRKRHPNVTVSVQTNAYRPLNRALLSLLAAHNVSLGVSLDGPASYNDRFRKDHSGHGSYDRVMETVSQIRTAGFQSLIGGFLTVANPAIPPKEYLAWIRTLPVRHVDVLWPIQFHHGSLPWRAYQTDEENYRSKPPVGRWFADLFEEWLREDDPELFIRLFFDVIRVLHGSHQHVDSLVNESNNMFVIDTDGSIEYPDYLRAAGDGACATPLNVFANALADLETESVFRYLLELGAHLPEECEGCSFRHPCGGGFLPGRMAPGAGREPRRRSVLCYDQFYFFRRVYSLLGLSMNGPASPRLFKGPRQHESDLHLAGAV